MAATLQSRISDGCGDPGTIPSLWSEKENKRYFDLARHLSRSGGSEDDLLAFGSADHVSVVLCDLQIPQEFNDAGGWRIGFNDLTQCHAVSGVRHFRDLGTHRTKVQPMHTGQ